eukprot:NODE_61_length_26588_cov_1.146778.p11 type:complete len:147 gc:universal NODE_61_length_26588_cov_1.146778:17458-17018(-)
MDGSHHTIVTPASLEEEQMAKEILENFNKALVGTPKANPECVEMNNNENNPFSVKATDKTAKKNLSSDDDVSSVIKSYFTNKMKRECEDIENEDECIKSLKKSKTEKELEMLDLQKLKERSIIYSNLKASGMEETLALKISGLHAQ